MKTVALIPIRAGSKGIPGKNMKEMCGKPLCFWVIDAALNAESIDEVWVSTDSQCYIELIEDGFGEQVRTLTRPEHFAQDDTPTEDVMKHFALTVESDTVVLLQATSPLTTPDDIEGALRVHEERGTSLLSVVEAPRGFYWKEAALRSGLCAINYDPEERPQRDEIEVVYKENGAIYITDMYGIMKRGSRIDDCASYYIMPPDIATEIDTPEDWDIVEKLLEARLS